MKATKEQIQFVRSTLESELKPLNLTMNAICSNGDCWILLTRGLNRISGTQPIDCCNVRDWKLKDLDDSHIETIFKHLIPKLKGPSK